MTDAAIGVMTAIIGGDVCPIGRNEPLFKAGDAKAIFSDLLPEIQAADLSIINMECPLIRQPSPIGKVGPALHVAEACVQGLVNAGIKLVGLANNHAMDHGPLGLETTMAACNQNGIGTVGAGADIAAAARIVVWEVRGVRLGILAVAEHEFGIAGTDAPGVNPLDVMAFVRTVEASHSTYDKLLVLVHGGNEHYPYPRPGLMDVCRFLVEQGANAVICQHSHSAGCMETYRGAPIIYGQGNFIFDSPSKYADWPDGLLVRLTVPLEGNIRHELIPLRQSDAIPGARRQTGAAAEKFLAGFDARSKAIQEPGFVERQFEIFCRAHKRYYLHSLHGKPGILRRVAGKLDLLHYLDSRYKQQLRLNLIRCESHHEALLGVLSAEANRLEKPVMQQP